MHANQLGVIKPDDLIGKTDKDFFPPEFAEKARQIDQKLAEKPAAGQSEKEKKAALKELIKEENRILKSKTATEEEIKKALAFITRSVEDNNPTYEAVKAFSEKETEIFW